MTDLDQPEATQYDMRPSFVSGPHYAVERYMGRLKFERCLTGWKRGNVYYRHITDIRQLYGLTYADAYRRRFVVLPGSPFGIIEEARRLGFRIKTP